MKRWVIVAVLLLAGSAAMAQAWRPFQFGFGAGGGTISPPPSCATGTQLDFSDVTGCNLVWAGH